ncbi:pek protein kinase [Plasmopara halstedii]|uniref:non-specific serine/threonine protein kinase n=1 Tax=Plasmopara halstedii TaxID=4781 RepID=A0A0P1A5J3_PLAHL|nr:pek protein kinase [Plasmopara halstedii]CEG35386.1 pek protein kinase [Plasmopara halstedii]|eukprot:XP_024571755.1 pek protein kinase [Plasmopara halstedii]
MVKSGGRFRWTRRRTLVLVVLNVLLLPLDFVTNARASVSPTYSSFMTQSPDVVIAGGLDGRVYAFNAWSGEVLWSFDSGGPMVDTSQCPGLTPTKTTESPLSYHTTAAKPRDRKEENLNVEGSVHIAAANLETKEVTGRHMIQERLRSAQAIAAGTAFISQLVPSYDGRLYHFSKAKVKELGMTMADIMRTNGPVHVAVDRDNDLIDEPSAAGILLFGEKKMEMFTLDAVSGYRSPFVSSVPSSEAARTILFGRSQFFTRAVNYQNSSIARCFKISEYFFDIVQTAHCFVEDGEHNVVPEIFVMPRDISSEGSTIVASDPWTKEVLWEFEIPDFDVLAVHGVSTSHGTTFYKWKVDGPSTTASRLPNARQDQHQIDTDHFADKAVVERREQGTQKLKGEKQLVPVIRRSWNAIESKFRLRLLGDNYFLESSKDDRVVDFGRSQNQRRSPTFHGRQPDDVHDLSEDTDFNRRRGILWEPIVNDGERGVFITYTHVGAMLLGVATCGMLLAWGCYAKGLSASLAQTAIQTMDRSQFFKSHVHRLVIQRPGKDDITISSVISSSLINALNLDGQVPQPLNILSTEVNAVVDPEIEAMLMMKFSRLAATEAAAIVVKNGHISATQKFLECDSDFESAAKTITSSSSASSMTNMTVRDSSMSSSNVQIPSPGPALAVAKRLSFDYTEENSLSAENIRGVYALKVLHHERKNCEQVISSAFESVIDHERFEFADSEDDISLVDDDLATNGAKSISSFEESTTGSCCSNSDSCTSHTKEKLKGRDGMEDVINTDGNLNEEKSSDHDSSEASSSGSATSVNEEEVLFPFVCQSRFANEFHEISALGKGGFGQVMLAENRLDGRQYAIKRVGLNLKNQTSKTLQKFLREVKILALLDHSNIVRYYQAWLEKVEEGTQSVPEALPSSSSTVTSVLGPRDPKHYLISNLLAPISKLEFSENQRLLKTFYSNESVISDHDDGFDWDRGSSSGVNDNGWKEEDLVVRNRPHKKGLVSQASISRPPASYHGNEDDSSLSAADTCDHWLYIQMQYCAGRNLADYLAVPTRPMELSRMLKIFVQIASALAHVHSCGLIHRDLKPANIFVADVERDEIKLGDFGLSRYAANVNNLNASASVDDGNQGSSCTGGLRETALPTSLWSNISESNEVTAGVGTYLYASPEQVAGKKYNAKTDMYSLGMILFELCHEKFGTTMERYITLRDARESKFSTGLRAAKRCPEILDMLRLLLSHDPTTRPTADEVVLWGQMMYETSLAQKAMDIVRSPRNLDVVRAAAAAHLLPSIDHLMTGAHMDSTTFSIKVEAVIDHCSGEDGGERRLPNHNLLKQVCDVIAGVSDGKVEIKKCGLHMESEGVTILEFELNPQAALADAPDSDVEGSVVVAIEALSGVQIVHRVSKIE